MKCFLNKFFSFVVLCFSICCSCVFSGETELNVFSVGQANLTILKNGNKALIFDCGMGSGSNDDWITNANDEIQQQQEAFSWLSRNKSHIFTNAKKTLLRNALQDVTDVTMVISHKHKDHMNLAWPMIRFLQEFSINYNVIPICEWNLGAVKKYPEYANYLNAILTSLDINDKPNPKIELILPNLVSSTDPHKACLMLKITAQNDLAFFLPGDSAGSSLFSKLVCFCKTSDFISITDIKSYLKNVAVYLFTHHGSAKEGALGWFDAVSDTYIANHTGSMPIAIQNESSGRIQDSQENLNDDITNLAAQIDIIRDGPPLLSIISSSSVGSDKIPSYDETILHILTRTATTNDVELSGQLFCATHDISCHFREVESFPDHFEENESFPDYFEELKTKAKVSAVGVKGNIAPIFSTENATGAGVYRIVMGQAGIKMYDKITNPILLSMSLVLHQVRIGWKDKQRNIKNFIKIKKLCLMNLMQN